MQSNGKVVKSCTDMSKIENNCQSGLVPVKDRNVLQLVVRKVLRRDRRNILRTC